MLAGSVHTPIRARFQPFWRCGTAVSVRPTRVAAPWKCSKTIADIGEGHAAKLCAAASIRPSLSPVVKLDRQ